MTAHNINELQRIREQLAEVDCRFSNITDRQIDILAQLVKERMSNK